MSKRKISTIPTTELDVYSRVLIEANENMRKFYNQANEHFQNDMISASYFNNLEKVLSTKIQKNIDSLVLIDKEMELRTKKCFSSITTGIYLKTLFNGLDKEISSYNKTNEKEVEDVPVKRLDLTIDEKN